MTNPIVPPVGRPATRTVEERLGRLLEERKLTLITAESCTGGLIAARLTAIPGSSDWFEGAFVTYRLRAKEQLLGVGAAELSRHGAVSRVVAEAMARGALAHSSADMSISVTGLAGPDPAPPVPTGTVWIGWHFRRNAVMTAAVYHFCGNRDAIRSAAAHQAILGAIELLEQST